MNIFKRKNHDDIDKDVALALIDLVKKVIEYRMECERARNRKPEENREE